MSRCSRHKFLFVALLAPLLTPAASLAQPERPSAMQLYPAETVLWVRTADAGLLMERMDQTLMAQMLRDPEMADITGRAGDAVTDAYGKYVKNFLEADLSELKKLPQGEIAFGLIHRPRSNPGVMLLADFGEQAEVAQQVVERLKTLAEEDDAAVATEQLRSDEATVIRKGNDQNDAVAIVRRESVFVVANDKELLQATLDRWDGIPIEPPVEESTDSDEETSTATKKTEPLYLEPLADYPSFSATLREIMPGAEEPPQAVFYVDPIGVLEATAGRNTGYRIAAATFPALGIDGIKAIGGTMWLATDKWDSLVRGHLLLGVPRSGVVKVARLETGELAPPKFIPASVESLMAAETNPLRLFDDIASLYDRFQYDGAFREVVTKNLSNKMGVDFENDIIAHLAGSVFYVTGYDESGKEVGGKPSLVLPLVDTTAAQATLDKLKEKFPDLFEEQTFGSLTYHAIVPGRMRERPPSERFFSPAVAIVDDCLVVTQSTPILKQMIEARDGQRPRLADSIQYRLVMSRLKRLTRGEPFSGVAYQDSEPMFRHFYGLATAEDSVERLDGLAERVTFFKYVREVIDGVELPPIETILKYNAPGGLVMIDTPTGWHVIGFGFKRGG